MRYENKINKEQMVKKQEIKKTNEALVGCVEHTIEWIGDLLKYSNSISDDLKIGLDLHKSTLQIAVDLHKIANKEVA